jgi:hypothetical protein
MEAAWVENCQGQSLELVVQLQAHLGRMALLTLQ